MSLFVRLLVCALGFGALGWIGVRLGRWAKGGGGQSVYCLGQGEKMYIFMMVLWQSMHAEFSDGFVCGLLFAVGIVWWGLW
jgi:hypothetical protein